MQTSNRTDESNGLLIACSCHCCLEAVVPLLEKFFRDAVIALKASAWFYMIFGIPRKISSPQGAMFHSPIMQFLQAML